MRKWGHKSTHVLRFTFYASRITYCLPRLTAFVLLFMMPLSATAGEIMGSVKNAVKGEPVEGTVVFVLKVSGVKFPPPAKPVPMDQVNIQFVPRVLPILVGTAVTFPNKDGIHHHLYSFSKAKRFERPLYKGTNVEPVIFDKFGIVKLGCNIHDTMSGIILVLQNPYFGITNKQGKYTIRNMSSKTRDKNIPPGKYKLVAWHEFMRNKIGDTVQDIEVAASGQITINYSLKIKRRKPTWKPERY